MFDDVSFARALHILGVVLWIGGVAFVTTVLLPAIRRMSDDEEPVVLFAELEGWFAWQARVTSLLVGISGLYMAYAWELWSRFTQIEYFWMHFMVFVWVAFSIVLFVAEPLFLHRWLLSHAKEKPRETFRLIQVLHWILLTVSLATVLADMLGNHGG
jgi:uncharacterized membrane protein